MEKKKFGVGFLFPFMWGIKKKNASVRFAVCKNDACRCVCVSAKVRYLDEAGRVGGMSSGGTLGDPWNRPGIWGGGCGPVFFEKLHKKSRENKV